MGWYTGIIGEWRETQGEREYEPRSLEDKEPRSQDAKKPKKNQEAKKPKKNQEAKIQIRTKYKDHKEKKIQSLLSRVWILLLMLSWLLVA